RLGRYLLQAVWKDDYDGVKRLIKKGADVNYRGPVYDSLLGRAESMVREKTAALVLACEGGDLRLARLLVSSRANVNIRDQDGNTPLHQATDEGHVAIVKF